MFQRIAMKSAVLVLVFALSFAVHAAADQLKTVNVPPGDLGKALRVLADQVGVEFIYQSDEVRGLHTGGVSGNYTAQDAVTKLLEGTPLQLRTDEPSGALLIGRSQASGTASGESKANSTSNTTSNVPSQNSDMIASQLQLAQVTQPQTAQSVRVDGSQEQAATPLNQIVVTGTHIRGIPPSSAPVLQFSREDIQEAGYSNVGEFIQRAVPQNFAAGASEDALNAGTRNGADLNTGDGTGINLRGLGNDSTLVLLNGRRMAPAGFGSFVDVSMIPAGAIERIDVLTDGASATYGSDAVGGVVNFVLRRDYDGAETSAAAGSLTEGDGDLYQFTQTFGNDWESGNVLFMYDFYQRDRLDSEDRSATADALDPTDILPRQTRNSVLLSANQAVSEDANLFIEGLYSERESSSRFFNPFTVVAESQDKDSQQLNVSAGTTISFGNSWRLEASGTYSENHLDSVIENDATDAFISQAVEDFSSTIAEVRADGDLMKIPGGAIKAALGIQYRTEDFDRSVVSIGQDERSYDRSVRAAFTELYVPIVGQNNAVAGINSLELTLSARCEEYSDFGSSTDPKVGLVWRPNGDLTMRGTWGTSFRAPLLPELDDSNIAVGILDFTDSSAADGTSFGVLLLGNNPSLESEQAVSWTVGADYKPASNPGLAISLTYFDIDFDDRIGFPDTLTLAFGDIASAQVAPFVDRTPDIDAVLDAVERATANGSVFDFTGGTDPATSDVIVDGRTQNLASTDVTGIDLTFRYEFQRDSGNWDISLGSSYLLGFDEKAAAGAPSIDVSGTVFNPAELKLRGGLGWLGQRFGTNLFVNHVSGLTDRRSTPAINIGSWTTVDFRISAVLTGLDDSPNGSTNAFLSILNVLDELPPFVADSSIDGFDLNFDPENHDIYGRSFLIGITHRW